MAVLKRYRMLLIVYVITLVFGTREFLIARAGGTVDWISACESAAGCSSTQQSSAPTDDSTFWSRHADMTEVVAQLNPGDPDTEFLLGMQASADGADEEAIARLEAALATGAKHNNYLLQIYAQYELSRGADWRRVNLAVNRWRKNHPFSADPLSLPLGTGPATPSDEADLHAALASVPWIAGSTLESSSVDGDEQWQLLITFRPGRVIDLRQAVEAVTILSLEPEDRARFEVRCTTLVDCTAVPR